MAGDSSLSGLRNKYEGERVFVLGNGPSLNDTPLEKLSDEFTLGVNKIPEIFDDTDWRPSFYLAVHGREAISKDTFDRILDLDIPSFLPREHLDFLDSRPNIYPLQVSDIREAHDIDRPWKEDFNPAEEVPIDELWCSDITNGVYGYTTVLYPAFQILDYMGFNEVYILGCDMYEVHNPHMIFESGDNIAEYEWRFDSTARNAVDFLKNADQPIRSLMNTISFFTMKSNMFKKVQPVLATFSDRFADPTHFYSDSGIHLGNRKRNERIRRSHRLARTAAEEYDFKIYNATIGGQLELYERKSLEDVLS